MAVRIAAVADDTGKPQEQYRYGVVWLKARTETDTQGRLVTLNDVAVTKINFPTGQGSGSAISVHAAERDGGQEPDGKSRPARGRPGDRQHQEGAAASGRQRAAGDHLLLFARRAGARGWRAGLARQRRARGSKRPSTHGRCCCAIRAAFIWVMPAIGLFPARSIQAGHRRRACRRRCFNSCRRPRRPTRRPRAAIFRPISPKSSATGNSPPSMSAPVLPS